MFSSPSSCSCPMGMRTPRINGWDPGSSMSTEPQIQREGEIPVQWFCWRNEVPLGRAVGAEAREAARFGFVGVDRERGGVATAGMGDVVGAAAQAALVPRVIEVEGQG